MMDLQRDLQGTRMAPYNGTHPGMQALGAFFREQKLFTFVRWGSFMCNPPSASMKNNSKRPLISSTVDGSHRRSDGS